MKRVNFHLEDWQIARLRDVAKAKGVSVAEVIRRAVVALLRKESRGK